MFKPSNLTSQINNQTSIVSIRVIGVLLLAYIAFITSWISDDAMISFRQILNFISGDGIVFNFGERVQAFTHPLWFLLLSGIISITREMFITTSILSVTLSLISVIMLLKLESSIAKPKLTFVSPVLFLAFSFSFCDYMTSGLENPLTYLLVSLLLLFLFQENKQKHLQLIFTILSLLVLNRYDYSILFLPLVILLIFDCQRKSELVNFLLPGFLLILGWVIFATIYFGSPLPNTFYAKLNAGYPKSEIFVRGLDYLESLKFDPASLIIIIIGFLSLILYRNRVLISLAFGKLLYLGYIVYIGGDFMLGRYFSILVLLSVGELLLISFKSKFSMQLKNFILSSLLFVFIVIGLTSGSPLDTFTDYQVRASHGGIADERGINYQLTGIFAKNRNRWPEIAEFKENAPDNYRVVCGTIGAIALTDNSRFHIDPCGLTEPFISRIPAIRYPDWRIGHHFRKIPFEYGEYKIGKISQLPDTELSGLANDVKIVTQGNLFSIPRFKAIWRLLTNSHSNLNFDQYVDPNIWIPLTESVELIKLKNWDSIIPIDNRPYWFSYSPQRSFNNNLRIESPISKNSSLIWVYLDRGYTYELYINNEKIYTLEKTRPYCSKGVKIFFKGKLFVKNVEIQAVETLNRTNYGFNYFAFIRLDELKDSDTDFESKCIVYL